MEIVQHIFDTLNKVPAEVYNQGIQVLITAFIASPLFLLLKKAFIKDREKIMGAVVIIGSIVSGAIVFIGFMPHDGPYADVWKYVAVVQGIVTYAATQPVWLYVVKPISIKAGKWWNAQVEQAATLKAQQTAAEPDTGVNPLV